MHRRKRTRYATFAGKACETWPCLFFTACSLIGMLGDPGWLRLSLLAGVALVGMAATLRALFLTGIEVREDCIVVRSMARTTRIGTAELKAIRASRSVKPLGYIGGGQHTRAAELVVKGGRRVYCPAVFGSQESVERLVEQIRASLDVRTR